MKHRTMKHIALYPLLAIVVLLAACNPTAAPSPVAELPTPVPDTISIVDAIARPSPLAGGNGAIYLTITNGSATAVQLSRVESPAAAHAEIHETIHENGVMRMVHQPDGFTVPPNGSLILSPGGKHIMLIDLVDALAIGNTIEVTFYFTHHGETDGETDEAAQGAITLTVAVAEPDSPGSMPDDPGDQAHDH
jgi:periplasmic copper chaperone A